MSQYVFNSEQYFPCDRYLMLFYLLLYGLLLIFALYNIIKFQIKESKWKVKLVSLFYICALIVIICRIIHLSLNYFLLDKE